MSTLCAPTRVARRTLRACVGLAFAFGGVHTDASVAPGVEWRFIVRLDGKPIGAHRFVVGSDNRNLTLASEADYEVTLLGLPVYRYRHRANERWSADCLASIDASTDDNGRLIRVRGQARDGGFQLQVGDEGDFAAAREASVGCLMSFAYWNPGALARQTRLLDPGTGRIESVVVTNVGDVPSDVDTQAQRVRGLRIGGLPQPIDIWYVGDRWIGLDTVVDGRRRLSYRLR